MMKLNVGIKSISIGSHAKKIYDELETVRPKHISFSLMLAIAADEYVKNHKRDMVKLDEFSSEDVNAKTPNFFAPMGEWVNYMSLINNEELNDVKERVMHLQRMLDNGGIR